MLNKLHQQNISRFNETNLLAKIPNIQFCMTKLIEEMGELAQTINKNLSQEEFEEEWADVIIVMSLMAHLKGISDLESIVKCKFNKTSKKKGSKIFIE